MRICDRPLTREELETLAASGLGDVIKGVVDVRREKLALNADQHVQLKELLERNGSDETDLWGINLFPGQERMLEYSSMINVRPEQGNRTLEVKDPALQAQIAQVVEKWTIR